MEYKAEIKPEPILKVDKIDLFLVNPYSEIDCEFIQVKNKLTSEPIINLKVESEFIPLFKQCEVVNEMILIGYGNRFCIFDMNERERKNLLFFNGYFSYFEVDNEDIFIASDSSLINIGLDGEEKWEADNLGIDGVVLSKITKTEIFGKGEWDPPNGWHPFILDRMTGKEKNKC